MKQFEIGKEYSMASVCNQDCVWSYTVIARTAQTITITDGKETKKCRIVPVLSGHRDAESVYPLGKYSMAPILSADHLNADITPVSNQHNDQTFNASSINIPSNFISVCESTLSRVASAGTEAARSAALGRQTITGLLWAIEFAGSLSTDFMSESELNHAIRLTYYRGAVRPTFNN